MYSSRKFNTTENTLAVQLLFMLHAEYIEKQKEVHVKLQLSVQSPSYMKGFDIRDCAGEFHLRLRQLEKSLLQALNDAKGKILDDDSVITTLETLKQEAADISKKVEETDKVIGEIETVSQQYMPLSQVCHSVIAFHLILLL